MGLDMYLTTKDNKREVYWRKANQIHGWFVENVQAGKDDCDRYEVTRDQLLELVKLCHTVTVNNDSAPDVLPTKEGFFFGTYDYDKDYMDDIHHTMKEVSALLQSCNDKVFYYNSSW